MAKKRIVVKVGTSTITAENGSIDFRSIDRLCRVLSGLHNSGHEIILVSSGAIAVGANKMKMTSRPTQLRVKQAAAAVGQCELMHIYDKFFGEYGNMVGQILLSGEDISDPEKKENLKNTFFTLVENGIIPIVNENDSVSHKEIEDKDQVFGDNDTLSAIVAVLCEATDLVLLSDIHGLYDSDPTKNPDAVLIKQVDNIDESVRRLAHGATSNRGTGGMISKLDAAEIATGHGIDMSIAFGRKPECLYDIADGKSVGTKFSKVR